MFLVTQFFDCDQAGSVMMEIAHGYLTDDKLAVYKIDMKFL